MLNKSITRPFQERRAIALACSHTQAFGSVTNSTQKKGGVGKIVGVILKKGGGITYFHTNPFQSYMSFSEPLVCAFCLFIPFLSLLFVFHRKNLALWHLINRYDFHKWIIFEKKRHCRKQIFDTSELFIQVNKDCCCEHIAVGVNIYLHGCVSLLAPVCVCLISNHSTSKKSHHVSNLSKLDALLQKTCIKVLRLDICTSMVLSEIAHQLWHNHPFSQRNKTTEWAVGVEVGGDREGRSWTKLEKVGVGNLGC